MSRRRKIIIPEIQRIASNLGVRGHTRLAAMLDDYSIRPVESKKVIPKKTATKIVTKNLDDKIAKFNFICGGNDAS